MKCFGLKKNETKLLVFLGNFDDAIAHVDRLRRFLPPLYNPSRVHELPIPPVNVTNIESEENEESDDERSVINEIHEISQQNNSIDEIKIEQFEQVPLEPEDLNAVNNLFAEDDQQLVESTRNANICEKIDEEVECTYASLNDFQPIIETDGYQIKLNDILSKWKFQQHSI